MDELAALFVDRDGVINEDRPDSVKSLSELRFLPGALEALALLEKSGLPVYVITNQAIVGRGIVERHVVDSIHAHMQREIRAAGGDVRAFHVCAHAPSAGCACRKPEPGLLLEASRVHGIDLSRAAFAGDDAKDLEAAARAGVVPLLVLTGKGKLTHDRVRSGELRARRVFADLLALARAAVEGTLLD